MKVNFYGGQPPVALETHWRLMADDVSWHGSYGQTFFETEFFESADASGTDVTDPAYASASTISSSSFQAGYGCDNNGSTRWSSTGAPGGPQWWQQAFPSRKAIQSITLTPYFSGNAYIPRRILLQASSNGVDFRTVAVIETRNQSGKQTFTNLQRGILDRTSENLVLELDATNSTSYSGTGQTWANLAGNPADGSLQADYNFYLGSSSIAEPSDPTFVGTPGSRSPTTYFEHGVETFVTKQGTNSAFLSSLHKAGAKFTLEIWCYPKASDAVQALIATGGTTAELGITLGLTATSLQPFLQVNRGVLGEAAFTVTADQPVIADTVNMLALAVDAERGSGYFYQNGSFNPVSSVNGFAVSYTDPSTEDSDVPMRIGSLALASSLTVEAGTRTYLVRIYNDMLRPSQLRQNWVVAKSILRI